MKIGQNTTNLSQPAQPSDAVQKLRENLATRFAAMQQMEHSSGSNSKAGKVRSATVEHASDPKVQQLLARLKAQLQN